MTFFRLLQTQPMKKEPCVCRIQESGSLKDLLGSQANIKIPFRRNLWKKRNESVKAEDRGLPPPRNVSRAAMMAG